MENYQGEDLSGTRQFFIRDESCPREIWKAAQMEFWVPWLMSDNYDNISCTGQTILLDGGAYHRIMFAGCSVWGSYFGKATINYVNKDFEVIPIELTNVGENTPFFGETPLWKGKVAKNKENVSKFEFWGYLYAKTYDLKQNNGIQSIQLPDYPNLHIFGISLVEL